MITSKVTVILSTITLAITANIPVQAYSTPKAQQVSTETKLANGAAAAADWCFRVDCGNKIGVWANTPNEYYDNYRYDQEYDRANDPNNCSGKGCCTVGGVREPQQPESQWYNPFSW